jgi:hypothetical protein
MGNAEYNTYKWEMLNTIQAVGHFKAAARKSIHFSKF